MKGYHFYIKSALRFCFCKRIPTCYRYCIKSLKTVKVEYCHVVCMLSTSTFFIQRGGTLYVDSRDVARIHPYKHPRWKALQQHCCKALPLRCFRGSYVCHLTLTTQKMNFSLQDLMWPQLEITGFCSHLLKKSSIKIISWAVLS